MDPPKEVVSLPPREVDWKFEHPLLKAANSGQGFICFHTQNLKPKDIEVCAKSGTAQIANSGQYADTDTIASYVGFSPCQNPKFSMIIIFNKPQLSTWGSSTAAPIWFEIASKITPLL